jgi:mRNA interferase MazF
MAISQGEIWWADLPAPTGSGPGFRRPVIVVQCDALNGSRLGTTVCVALTSNLKWGTAPGNVSLSARLTGLPKDSVANVSQIVTVDKDLLAERAGKLPRPSWSYCFLESTLCLEGSPSAVTPDAFHTNFFTCNFTCKSSGLGVLSCA